MCWRTQEIRGKGTLVPLILCPSQTLWTSSSVLVNGKAWVELAFYNMLFGFFSFFKVLCQALLQYLLDSGDTNTTFGLDCNSCLKWSLWKYWRSFSSCASAFQPTSFLGKCWNEGWNYSQSQPVSWREADISWRHKSRKLFLTDKRAATESPILEINCWESGTHSEYSQ